MRIEVTCPKCRHKFWMDDHESKACPKCGFVVIGPKAKTRSSGPCFITTASIEVAGLPDNCMELEAMRFLRDEYLLKSGEGRKMVEEYYEIAPHIVEVINKDERKEEIYNWIWEKIKYIVKLIESGDLEEAVRRYRSMVLRLKQKYLTNSPFRS